MGVVINETSVVVAVEQAREMYSSQHLRYDYGKLFCKVEDSVDVFLWLNKSKVITTDAAGSSGTNACSAMVILESHHCLWEEKEYRVNFGKSCACLRNDIFYQSQAGRRETCPEASPIQLFQGWLLTRFFWMDGGM
jgi:hypothetical protein